MRSYAGSLNKLPFAAPVNSNMLNTWTDTPLRFAGYSTDGHIDERDEDLDGERRSSAGPGLSDGAVQRWPRPSRHSSCTDWATGCSPPPPPTRPRSRPPSTASPPSRSLFSRARWWVGPCWTTRTACQPPLPRRPWMAAARAPAPRLSPRRTQRRRAQWHTQSRRGPFQRPGEHRSCGRPASGPHPAGVRLWPAGAHLRPTRTGPGQPRD